MDFIASHCLAFFGIAFVCVIGMVINAFIIFKRFKLTFVGTIIQIVLGLGVVANTVLFLVGLVLFVAKGTGKTQ